MKSLLLSIIFISVQYSFLLAQNEIEFFPDGIILPRLFEVEKPSITKPGHLIFNLNTNRTELFTGNFQWETINGNKLIDDDQDSELFLQDGVDNDFLTLRLNGNNKFSWSSNESGIPRFSFSGTDNNLIGLSAGTKTSVDAHNNIALGNQALFNNGTADNNIALGSKALFHLNVNDDGVLFGSNNIALGHEAGMTGNPNNSVFIGPYAGKNASNVNNTLYISNAEGDDPLVYGEFGNKLFRVNGSLETNERSIFMTNLGGDDSDQGIKWGESGDSPVFGITYDGTGSNESNSLKIREYIGDQEDIMTIDAGGIVSLERLVGDHTGPVMATSSGALIRNQEIQWVNWNPREVEPAQVLIGGPYACINHIGGPPTSTCTETLFIPLRVPDNVKLKRVKIYYQENNNLSEMSGVIKAIDIRTQVNTEIGSTSTSVDGNDIRTEIIEINDCVVHNEETLYQLEIQYIGFAGNLLIYGAAIGYVY